MTRPRLLLLDGHSLAYRAFYALPVENFSTTTGQPTNAVYGFTSMLINALRDEKPTHTAVAFDVSRRTFRTERFPEYKANRSESPDGFRGQVELIKQVLDAMSIPSIEAPGFEADDIIATLTAQATDAGFDVDIITGDRDAFQLVNEHVTVLYPRKGVSDLARMTPAAVKEKYGLTPTQYPDYAAIRGDSSDNLPQIPSVGEKTASKWITEFGDLTTLVSRADEVRGKVGEALRAHLDQVLLNRQLTELIRDVPLDRGPEDLERQTIDRALIHEVFDALQFRVLRERLFDTLGDEVTAAAQAATIEVQVATPGDVELWLRAHKGMTVAIAASGTWGRGTGDITAMALSAHEGQVLWIDPIDLSAQDEEALRSWLADQGEAKILHDAKGPMLALNARGLPLDGLANDTALAAYLVLPGQRSFDLADLTARLLGRDLESQAPEGQLLFGDEDAGAETLGQHARAIHDLSIVLEDEAEKRSALGLLRDVELPLVNVLAKMEIAGIAVDVPRLHDLEQGFGSEIARVEEEAQRIVGRAFNLGSPKQLQEILFGELGLPKTKRIKTGYTTDAEALATLFATTGHPLLEQLLRWRDVAKLRQTVAGLIPLAANGRIHTTFNQTVAATGRLSSTDPNLQNIPIRTDEGRQIRDCFVVGEGYESLMTADYSQIEMRIMAHLSADEGLISAFTTGEDLHTTVASRVFEVAPDSVDAEMRRRIKAMSYGLAYGLSAYGLSQQLAIGTDEAKRLMDEYFERFGGIRDYLSSVVDTARQTGYTETVMGRRRYLPDLTSDNRQRREMAERMALNAPIQGSAADIIKVAMLNVDRAIAASGLASRMLLQVHDELVFEVAPGEEAALEELVRREMAGAADLSVPLDVSVGIGATWQSAGH